MKQPFVLIHAFTLSALPAVPPLSRTTRLPCTNSRYCKASYTACVFGELPIDGHAALSGNSGIHSPLDEWGDDVLGMRRRSGKALLGGLALLLSVALAGCGDDGEKAAEPTASASVTHGGGTASASASSSDAPTAGLLYQGKEVTLSNVWAVKHDCPSDVYVEFADSGPRVLDPNEGSPRDEENSTEEGSPPALEWTPPCTQLNSQIDFDQVPVAKVTGEQTQTSCQGAAQESLSDGTSHDAYGSRALAVGDQFCEDFGPGGRVVLMQVEKLSGTPVSEITLSVTLWAGPAQEDEGLPQPGETVYADKPLTLGDKVAEANDCAIGLVGLSTNTPTVSYEKGAGVGSGADISYFPSCVSGDAKVRFAGYVASVEGSAEVDVTACQDAAAAGESGSLDVPITELRAGDRYCQYDSSHDSVALVEVTAVSSASPASVRFSATFWGAPEAP